MNQCVSNYSFSTLSLFSYNHQWLKMAFIMPTPHNNTKHPLQNCQKTESLHANGNETKTKGRKKRSCTIPSSPQEIRCLTNKVMTMHPALFHPILEHPACGFLGLLAVSRHLKSQDLILLKAKIAPFQAACLLLQVSHTSTQGCPCFSMCKITTPKCFSSVATYSQVVLHKELHLKIHFIKLSRLAL